MRKTVNSLNSKVSGYSIEQSRVVLYGKDNTCRIYNTVNVGYERLVMIKAIVLSGQAENLWTGQYDFIV